MRITKCHFNLINATVIIIFIFSTWSCEEPITHTSIITSEVENITIAKATCGGFIADDGGSGVSARGIIWGFDPYINLVNNEGMTQDSTGIGKFVSRMTVLTPGTAYYVRAYATNEAGTYYGLPKSFATQNGVVDIEENEYHYVIIGTQTWMKENLRTTKYNDGTDILLLTNLSEYTTPTYTWYDDNIANKDNYGGYYSYAAVTTGKLCPAGWHVPTESEWNILASYLGGPLVAGKKLKTTYGWENSGNGTDEYGFSAVPVGYRLNDFDMFRGENLAALWWMADKQVTRYISFDMDYLYTMTIQNPISIGVRCLKNQ